jgi:hypothetical protein
LKSFYDIAPVKRLCLLNALIMCMITVPLLGQKKMQDSIDLGQNRKLLHAKLITGAVYAGSMTALYQAWYRDFPFQRFHMFNDVHEWRGMDKLGHATTSWWTAQWLFEGQQLTGLPSKNALLRSVIVPFCFMSTIEILDGFSSGWGFSMTDMAANTGGLALFYFQQKYLNEQRFLLRYSYHSSGLAALRPNLLGANTAERFLKDYNGQTYWLSYPVKRNSFLYLSLGYSARGMLGARDNTWLDSSGQLKDYHFYRRYSKWSLSFDVDLMKLPIRGKAWKWFASTFRWVKFPLPAINWSNPKGFQFSPFYF